MANLFCYFAGIVMLIPAFILDVAIKVIYVVYYIGYISVMSFINPNKARACRYDYDYKYTAFGLKFFFCEKAIEFYFKNV